MGKGLGQVIIRVWIWVSVSNGEGIVWIGDKAFSGL